MESDFGETALDIAERLGHSEVVHMLCAAGD